MSAGSRDACRSNASTDGLARAATKAQPRSLPGPRGKYLHTYTRYTLQPAAQARLEDNSSMSPQAAAAVTRDVKRRGTKIRLPSPWCVAFKRARHSMCGRALPLLTALLACCRLSAGIVCDDYKTINDAFFQDTVPGDGLALFAPRPSRQYCTVAYDPTAVTVSGKRLRGRACQRRRTPTGPTCVPKEGWSLASAQPARWCARLSRTMR